MSQLCSTAFMADIPSPACVKLKSECYALQSCSMMLQRTKASSSIYQRPTGQVITL